MTWFPYEKFDVVTKLTPDEILERLFSKVEANQRFNLFANKQSDYAYEGSISTHTFFIQRKINYRNSFKPEIRGIITAEGDVCRIHITMKLNLAVIIFTCVWLGGVFFTGIVIVISQFQKQKFEPASLMVVFMFLFGYILATGGFKFESGNSKKFLQQLFEAYEV